MTVPKSGHIKVPRKDFAGKLWSEKRVFSKFEAMLDMTQLAQYQAREYTSTKFGTIRLERGEFILSLRKMAERWGWSIQSTRSFTKSATFRTLLATQRETQAGTVYLIKEYDLTQGGEEPTNTPSNTAINTPLTHLQHTSNTRTSSKALTTTTPSGSDEPRDAVLRPPRKAKAEPKYPDYSAEARQRLHKEWSMRKGVIAFPRYVKATGPLFPQYTVEQVSAAQLLAIQEAKESKSLRFLTPEGFAQNIVDLVERAEKDPVADGWFSDWTPQDAGLSKRRVG